MVTKIKVACFDLDGTLIDSVVRGYEAVSSIFADCNIVPPPFEEWCRKYTPPDYTFFEERGITLTRQEFIDLYHDRAKHEVAQLYPDVIECLAELNSMDVGLCLVTSQRQHVAQERCHTLGILPYFQLLRADSPDKADCLLATCRQLRLEPADLVYVGDFGHDMRDACRAGVMPIGITRGNQTRAMLLEEGAQHVVDQLVELVSIVADLNS